MALDLKRQLGVKVYGMDANNEHERLADELNLVHDIRSIEGLCEEADVLLLATPVDKLVELLPQLLNRTSDQQVVIDMGSTKGNICNHVKSHPNRSRYVAAHPLAGTEYSGPTAAQLGLFDGKKNIICDRSLSDAAAVDLAVQIFDSLGMETLFMDSQEHDRHLAYVSHLSHVTSFTLGLTVLDIEKDEDQIFNLASTGFRSTARLAKSNPATWRSIFENNDTHVLEALDAYIDNLQKFRSAIATSDGTGLTTLMKEANAIKRIIN